LIGKLSYYLAKFNRLFAVAALLLILFMAYNTTIPDIESDLAGYNVDDNPYDSAGLSMAEILLVNLLAKKGPLIEACAKRKGFI
jgi:hypothetical protein